VKLIKIETEEGTKFPSKKKFYLHITESYLDYNLDVNICRAGEFKITADYIKISVGGCTK
jgi:hypothetical protein